jgi:hypothetical protein
MNETSEARSRYLALALASRNALRLLATYVNEGRTDRQLEITVTEVLDSLKATREETNLFGPIPDESPFTNYEQLLTLDEVVKNLEDRNIVDNLTNLLSTSGDENSRRRNAEEAVKFFYALENRALHHYSRQIGTREP